VSKNCFSLSGALIKFRTLASNFHPQNTVVVLADTLFPIAPSFIGFSIESEKCASDG
jgi:hypothetical protein